MTRKYQSDEVFKEKLNDVEVSPPEHLWGEIADRLDSRDRRIRFLWIKRVAVAAALVLAFFSGWELQFSYSKRNIAKSASMVANRPKSTREKGIVFSATSSNKSNIVALSSDRPVRKQEFLGPKRSSRTKMLMLQRIHSREGTVAYLKGKDLNLSLQKQHVTEKYTPEYIASLSSKEITKTELSLQKLKDVGEKPKALSVDEIIVAQNLEKIEYSKTKRKLLWSVGAQLASSNSLNSPQSSEKGTSSNSVMSDLVPPSTQTGNLKINLGTGLTFSVQTSKRLSIQSGLFYSKIQQASSGVYQHDNLAMDSEAPFASLVLERAKNIVDTPWGEARIHSHHRASLGLSSVDNALFLAGAASVSGGVDINQQAEYMEIPLLLRYKLFDHRFGVDLLGGMGANFLVGNDLYEVKGDDKQRVGETSDMNSFTYSSILGIGFSYGLSSKMRFSLEPKMKYYLNSLSNNRSVNMTPWIFGVYAGFNFNF